MNQESPRAGEHPGAIEPSEPETYQTAKGCLLLAGTTLLLLVLIIVIALLTIRPTG